MPTVTAPTLVRFQNILFATDFSLSSQAAVPFAYGLAHRYGAELHTVNVLFHQPFVEAAAPAPEQIQNAAKQRLAAFMAPTAFQKIKHEELIEVGEVPEVISRLVRKNHMDLIVIGTGGRTGVGKLLLGSVAEEVFRTAECPVLTVGPHVARGNLDGTLHHILYATDFGTESVHALPYAISLAEEHRARLTLMHTAPEPGIALPEPEPGSQVLISPGELIASTEKALRELIPAGTQLWHEPEYSVLFGDPVETIVRPAQKDVDLIVLGVKRPGALTKHLGAGVAYRVVCEAPCPVLSVGAMYHAW